MAVDSRVGTELAGYRIESILGRGGMGTVYLAHHRRLDRKVALKVLAPELAEDKRFRDRFVRESQMAAALEHPNVVPIHEAGEADGLLFIAMRYIRGSDLRTIIEAEGPLDLARTTGLLTQVAGALDEAHAQGLIHRDVKPANILVAPARGADSPEHAYLTDFGLTKRRTSDSGITKTGQFMGTVDYVAPEQIEGKPVDARADVYSLGCVLYQCLTGEPPFPRDTEVATIYAHLHEPPPKPREAMPDLPSGIDEVVAKAMSKAPQRRYQTCGDLGKDLGLMLAPEPGPRPGRGRPMWRVGAAAAAVALAVVVVAVVLTGSGDGNPSGRSSTIPPSPLLLAALTRIDPGTDTIVKTFPTLTGSVAIGDGFAWALALGEVQKISLATNEVVAHIPVHGGPGYHSASLGDGTLWIAEGSAVGRIDPTTNEVTEFDLGGGVFEVAADMRWVWALNPQGVVRIDPRSGKVMGPIDIPAPLHIVVGEGAVWVTGAISDDVFKIDPLKGRVVDRIPIPGGTTDIAVGEGAVWVSNSASNTVFKVDPVCDCGVQTIPVGSGPKGLAVAAGSVWVANSRDGTISRIDATTGNVEKTIPIGTCAQGFASAGAAEGGPAAVAADDMSVWVTAHCGGGS